MIDLNESQLCCDLFHTPNGPILPLDDSPKVERKGVRSPAHTESQEPVSEAVPSAAMRSSAAATIALKRGSSRRGSRSGSTLACFRKPLATVSKKGPSSSSAVSTSGGFMKDVRLQAKL